ncbi:hypothetical protein Tco_0989982 [Tanacetum coccineum]|uniref:Reverse transcriptase domain-containing protein n=1 Tax=Tanacetum coccineum TaxID=301880 RepID=A0ABQ5EV80_9ASTR
MRTRSQSRNSNRQQQQVNPTFVEPFNLVEPIENQAPPVVMMDDTRTMAQLLEASTVGYEDAIVVPEITADNFELKHGLLTLVQNKQFFGYDKEDPHAHIRYFNKITSMMKFPNVPIHQAPPYQALAPQTQGVTKTDFESYVKANDSVMRNMQDQNQNMQKQMTNLTDTLSKFVNSNTASTLRSGTLPSNTITNPNVDFKGITTRSGVAYQGPTIPTTSSSPQINQPPAYQAPPYQALAPQTQGELTLRVGKEAVTFNLDQTSRYSSNYDDNSVNRIDIIEMACEEYDFLLEEVDAFLALEDDPTSTEVDHSYYDPEGDIILLEAFLNDDPSLPPPTQGNYLPEIRKELKVCEAKNDKSSIDEPPEVELKDLHPHLEYAFLRGDGTQVARHNAKETLSCR